MDATMSLRGGLARRVIRGVVPAPLSWRVRNSLRWSFIWGTAAVFFARLFSRLTGLPVLISELRAVHIRNGKRIDHGVVSRRQVTDTGVGYIVDAFANSVELENMKYHGVGTGGAAEGAGNTALTTESTTILNPDSTRATGSTIEGATGNIYKTVGTVAFDGSGAITEQGIFSQAATGGGVMIDRHLFSAINVVSGDSIEFTYQLTFTSGG